MFSGSQPGKIRMYIGKTLFAQIMDFIPWTSFGRIVARYRGNARVRSLPCTEQFRVMAFAQMTWRESLRDIEACLSVQSAKLYHMGVYLARAICLLAEIYLQGGRYADGVKRVDLALATAVEIGDEGYIPKMHMVRASLLAHLGHSNV